ncbi:transposase [Candidatus Woesearchaeota archaeon]|nr:transposase [Candidatus Woesearchaeota archaeon]
MCLILKIFWCSTFDGVEAKLKANKEFLLKLWNVDRLPTHSVIHEAMNLVTMKQIRRIIRKTFRKLGKKLCAATDSTGMSTRNSSLWFDIRIKRKNSKKDCIKIHIIIDINQGYILDYHITNHKKNDCPILEKILRNIKYLRKLVADAGYLSRKNCTLVGERGGKPYIAVKSNSTPKSKGSKEWKVMVDCFIKHKGGFKKAYNCRSIIESVFSSMKRRWNSTLRSLKKWYQRKELAIKVICYNIKEFLYNWRAGQLGIPRWKKS